VQPGSDKTIISTFRRPAVCGLIVSKSNDIRNKLENGCNRTITGPSLNMSSSSWTSSQRGGVCVLRQVRVRGCEATRGCFWTGQRWKWRREPSVEAGGAQVRQDCVAQGKPDKAGISMGHQSVWTGKADDLDRGNTMGHSLRTVGSRYLESEFCCKHTDDSDQVFR
jgi:hypothetical protein